MILFSKTGRPRELPALMKECEKMIFADYHVHTSFSGDCSTPMEEVILTGIRKGIKEIAFTDHADFYIPGEHNKYLVNYDEYVPHFYALRNKYLRQINLLLGVELGCHAHSTNKSAELVRSYPFDFVICSAHCSRQHSYSSPAYYNGKNQYTAYLEYLEHILSNVKNTPDYDVLGHLDFIVRYSPYPEKNIPVADFQDLLDEILRTVIDTGHGLEVNTAPCRYGMNQTNPDLAILKRYRELGGEIITIGSDAHTAEMLASNFHLAEEVLKTAGFKWVTCYNNRNPLFLPVEV